MCRTIATVFAATALSLGGVGVAEAQSVTQPVTSSAATVQAQDDEHDSDNTGLWGLAGLLGLLGLAGLRRPRTDVNTGVAGRNVNLPR